MIRHILTGTCDLPAGTILVVIADAPEEETDIYDSRGAVKRKFWVKYRIFKRRCNADKYIERVKFNHRNESLNKFLVEKKIFNFN